MANTETAYNITYFCHQQRQLADDEDVQEGERLECIYEFDETVRGRYGIKENVKMEREITPSEMNQMIVEDIANCKDEMANLSTEIPDCHLNADDIKTRHVTSVYKGKSASFVCIGGNFHIFNICMQMFNDNFERAASIYFARKADNLSVWVTDSDWSYFLKWTVYYLDRQVGVSRACTYIAFQGFHLPEPLEDDELDAAKSSARDIADYARQRIKESGFRGTTMTVLKLVRQMI